MKPYFYKFNLNFFREPEVIQIKHNKAYGKYATCVLLNLGNLMISMSDFDSKKKFGEIEVTLNEKFLKNELDIPSKKLNLYLEFFKEIGILDYSKMSDSFNIKLINKNLFIIEGDAAKQEAYREREKILKTCFKKAKKSVTEIEIRNNINTTTLPIVYKEPELVLENQKSISEVSSSDLSFKSQKTDKELLLEMVSKHPKIKLLDEVTRKSKLDSIKNYFDNKLQGKTTQDKLNIIKYTLDTKEWKTNTNAAESNKNSTEIKIEASNRISSLENRIPKIQSEKSLEEQIKDHEESLNSFLSRGPRFEMLAEIEKRCIESLKAKLRAA